MWCHTRAVGVTDQMIVMVVVQGRFAQQQRFTFRRTTRFCNLQRSAACEHAQLLDRLYTAPTLSLRRLGRYSPSNDAMRSLGRSEDT